MITLFLSFKVSLVIIYQFPIFVRPLDVLLLLFHKTSGRGGCMV